MKIKDHLVEGEFISEHKNRFLCTVKVKDSNYECYVPSASRLSNYIKLKGKKVLLIENKGQNSRTKYSLFGIKFYNKYIMLNLNIANKIASEYINKKLVYDEMWSEKVVGVYKADFILNLGSNVKVVEVKGIITTSKQVIFPSVFSKRAIEQLKILLELMKEGKKVTYIYVSLSPTVEQIFINEDDIEYYTLLKECVKNGMQLIGLRSYFQNEEIVICENVSIHFN